MVVMPNYMTTYRTTFLAILIFLSTSLLGQEKSSTRNFICFTPTSADKANGLIIGLWNHPRDNIQIFNGLNIEILGSGWTTPFLGMDDGGYVKKRTQTINGLSIGLTLMHGQMNGVSICPTVNTTFYFNGLKIGLLNFDLHKSNGLQIAVINSNDENNGVVIEAYNRATKTKGIQIGLINRSDELRGLQIGLININDSRTLPFINWTTRKKK